MRESEGEAGSGAGARQQSIRFCSQRFHLTNSSRCDRMKKLTVLDELLRKLRKMTVSLSSQIIYLTKTTECDKIEKLVTARRNEKKTFRTSVHKMFT